MKSQTALQGKSPLAGQAVANSVDDIFDCKILTLKHILNVHA